MTFTEFRNSRLLKPMGNHTDHSVDSQLVLPIKRKEDPMKGKRPNFVVSTVTSTENGDRWREIGVGFTNDAGDTITVLLDALPVSGKLVLRAPKPQRDAQPA